MRENSTILTIAIFVELFHLDEFYMPIEMKASINQENLI